MKSNMNKRTGVPGSTTASKISAKSSVIAISLAVFSIFTLVTACEQSPGSEQPADNDKKIEDIFVAVTGIAGVQEIAALGNHTLTGTVEPADATNTTITWTITEDGTTGATINGSTLHTTANGILTVSAAIANGTAEGTDFTKDFTLTVTTPITNIADLAPYLAASSGGQNATSPVPVLLEMELTAANWNDTLAAINSNHKFVSLDLSACTKSGASSGGGLSSTGDFDPLSTISTGKDKIANLTLPATETRIVGGDYANPTFKHFTALKTVSGAGVTSIGSRAFLDCAALTSVSFPAATSIGIAAFYGCTGLTSVSFPVVASIGNVAFYGCRALTSISFPAAASIGSNAFSGCAALTGISFPAADSIGDGAFSGCAVLTSVSLPVAAAIGNDAFSGCAVLTGVSFPVADYMGDGAFSGCAVLTGVSLPAVASIGDGAFSGCTALSGVTLGAAPPKLGTGIFSNIKTAQTVTVRIPENAQTAYGVSNLPATNFANSSTANSWGRAFKGSGWGGGTFYGTGEVNTTIILRFETYQTGK
jgi:hypothetical protein